MTIFTAQDSALLLIDRQVGTMQLIKNIHHDVVKQNAIALAKTAKILGLPVVLTSSQDRLQPLHFAVVRLRFWVVTVV